MFLDWLSIYQDHDHQLPLVSARHFIAVDTETGEDLGIKQDTLQHAGSYSTSINIRVSGNRVTVTGNPSRVNRMENLFGYTTVDQCVEVYNRILSQYGLPPFTKCTKVWHVAGEGSKIKTITDGAVITELHITSNVTTGSTSSFDHYQNLQYERFESHADTYIKAISTLPYRNSIPRLHTNGKTCDWLTKRGKGSTLIYPSVYNKAFELELHALPKIKRSHGVESDEYKYLQSVIDYCNQHGVVRFEQKLKSAFLRRNNMQFYGLSNFKALRAVHDEFINLHKKLKVESMTLESITQQLLNAGICETWRSANVTTMYAIQWMHGHQFDFSKSQVKTHRARLRKIGIDIAMPCDVTKFSLVTVKEAKQITVGQLVAPTWYRRPATVHLKIAA